MQQERANPVTGAGSSTPVSPVDEGVPIVGVGASAGGLDAFSRLLRRIPCDTGYAFVLVQHLDATHPSSLSEILGRATAMPVGEAEDGTPVAANRIYVIPPNTELTTSRRVLRLGPRASSAHMPIDRFLQSLARDCGSRAVGVILSGNGSDGSAGLVAIKEAGGVTFAQEPSSAEFPSMPTMAVAAGGVDLVLAPDAIAAELARLAQHPTFAPSEEPAPPAVDVSQQIRAICGVMHQTTGIDFSLYRETTMYRRIQRRLALRDVDSLEAYTQLLAGDANERNALKRDVLIGVTSFFRDPEPFEALKRLVFPTLVAERPTHSTIRIWVPGCASGEEAYSILMVLDEYQSEARTSFPVQLFGSDISDAGIDKARAARYPDAVARDVSPERLARYFSKVEDGYQIGKALRERCVFSRHNLLDDPPFSRLDLISCRNVLIYLDAAQKRIIPLFHYALEARGFLMLGRSETAHFPDMFSPIEPQLRIFAKRRMARKSYGFFARGTLSRRGSDTRAPVGSAPMAGAREGVDLSRDADRLLLSKYSPAGVLVDENLEVLEIRGRAAPFLALQGGKLSFNLLKLLPDTGLFLEVEKLTQEAGRTDAPAHGERVAYEAEGHFGEVNIEVTPLRGTERRAFLILFEPVGAPGDAEGAAAPPPRSGRGQSNGDRHLTKLKHDLEVARQRLVSMVEDHENSEQESQQVTEDALSANEELQSLTEELETAKEELQSTNEELITVNRDLESRNAALTSARDVARSIVETVGVPLVVVDLQLEIRRVNMTFATAFRVDPVELEGQPIGTVCGGAWDAPEIRRSLESLRSARVPFGAREVERDVPPLGPRVLILSASRLDPLDLLLLTVVDVTELRRTEEALKRSEEQRRESEKMETVGRLAGGIAHDFNNLLTVIMGYGDLVVDALNRHEEPLDDVNEIRRSAQRAAALTDQLLAFSRRKVLQPRVFNLNPLIVDFEKMLRRLLTEHIDVVVRLAPDLWHVRADPGEVGRVVMNLSLNSRDAMPAGGTLTLETENVALDVAAASGYGVPEGRYVRLTVRDSGIGMNPETHAHIFEPFFTTKEIDKGTGLGLSTVLGIVQQSGGAVTCDSEVGQGTAFSILLPAAAPEQAMVDSGLSGMVGAAHGSVETVLLAEDEPAVRGLARRILESAGYVVLEADDGRQALALIESHEGVIDLLVSDVMMPDIGGRELVEKATVLRPGLKVLIVSGHTDDVILKEHMSRRAEFLAKPFTPSEFARKVRDTLDA